MKEYPFNASVSQVLEKLNLFNCIVSCGAHDVKINGSNHDEKSSFKMSGLSFSLTFYYGSFMFSSAKGFTKNQASLVVFFNVILF